MEVYQVEIKWNSELNPLNKKVTEFIVVSNSGEQAIIECTKLLIASEKEELDIFETGYDVLDTNRKDILFCQTTCMLN